TASYRISGIVKLLRLSRSSGKRVPISDPTYLLSSPLRACDLGPTREAFPHLLAVVRRRQQMPPWSEVLGNGSIRRQKTLGMAGGLEPLHTTLTLTRGTVRVLTPVVQITTLPMFHTWQYLTLGRAVALQLIRDDHSWHVLQP